MPGGGRPKPEPVGVETPGTGHRHDTAIHHEDVQFFQPLWHFRHTIGTYPSEEMTVASQIRTAVDFYERHPISAQIILTQLEAARGSLDGLRPDELFRHDQDHYGGTAANDALAKCANGCETRQSG